MCPGSSHKGKFMDLSHVYTQRVRTKSRDGENRRFSGGSSTIFPRKVMKRCPQLMVCRSKNGIGDNGASEEYQLRKLEIQEPAIERGAEQAALSVMAATVFGAILWGVLGSTKGEGVFQI